MKTNKLRAAILSAVGAVILALTGCSQDAMGDLTSSTLGADDLETEVRSVSIGELSTHQDAEETSRDTFWGALSSFSNYFDQAYPSAGAVNAIDEKHLDPKLEEQLATLAHSAQDYILASWIEQGEFDEVFGRSPNPEHVILTSMLLSELEYMLKEKEVDIDDVNGPSSSQFWDYADMAWECAGYALFGGKLEPGSWSLEVATKGWEKLGKRALTTAIVKQFSRVALRYTLGPIGTAITVGLFAKCMYDRIKDSRREGGCAYPAPPVWGEETVEDLYNGYVKITYPNGMVDTIEKEVWEERQRKKKEIEKAEREKRQLEEEKRKREEERKEKVRKDNYHRYNRPIGATLDGKLLYSEYINYPNGTSRRRSEEEMDGRMPKDWPSYEAIANGKHNVLDEHRALP